jgi:hypothetical protein
VRTCQKRERRAGFGAIDDDDGYVDRSIRARWHLNEAVGFLARWCYGRSYPEVGCVQESEGQKYTGYAHPAIIDWKSGGLVVLNAIGG